MNIEMPRQTLDLASAIAEADIRVLLMCLVHLTGDMSWLAPPYSPKRDVRLIPDPHAGIPAAGVGAEVRAAALALLERGSPRPAIADPGDELIQRMMSVTARRNRRPNTRP